MVARSTDKGSTASGDWSGSSAIRLSHESRSRHNPYQYEARIIVQSYSEGSRTLRTYRAGGKGPAQALADALAEFLTLEDFDFHDSRQGGLGR